MQKLLLLPCMALLSLVTYSQSSWKPTYEDEEVKIEYKLSSCDDSPNGFSFQYYFLRIENKTQRSLNLQYLLGTPNDGASEDELTSNLILAPAEILQGQCTDNAGTLKYFYKDNKCSIKTSNQFTISKIKVYAL